MSPQEKAGLELYLCNSLECESLPLPTPTPWLLGKEMGTRQASPAGRHYSGALGISLAAGQSKPSS